MDLPEIPDELFAAAEIDPDERYAVKAAWPHLYALAARHLADLLRDDDNYYDSMAGFSSLTQGDLHDLADDAIKPA